MVIGEDMRSQSDDKQKNQKYFDEAIGQLDRLLSKVKVWSKDETIDEANRQTLKHHADDLIGVGNKMLEILEPSKKK